MPPELSTPACHTYEQDVTGQEAADWPSTGLRPTWLAWLAQMGPSPHGSSKMEREAGAGFTGEVGVRRPPTAPGGSGWLQELHSRKHLPHAPGASRRSMALMTP